MFCPPGTKVVLEIDKNTAGTSQFKEFMQLRSSNKHRIETIVLILHEDGLNMVLLIH